MRDQLKALWTRWRDLSDIAGMSERDLADLNLTRADAVALLHLPSDAPARVAAMARIFGLSEAEMMADPSIYREVLTTCGHCGARHQCGTALDNPATTPADTGFCANATSYAAWATLPRN